MALGPEQKKQIIAEYVTHEGDISSPEVQVALLSARIKELAKRSRTYGRDHHSRRDLVPPIGQRKRLLTHLTEEDIERYRPLTTRLGLRR